MSFYFIPHELETAFFWTAEPVIYLLRGKAVEAVTVHLITISQNKPHICLYTCTISEPDLELAKYGTCASRTNLGELRVGLSAQGGCRAGTE
jgi:hypothetical protein